MGMGNGVGDELDECVDDCFNAWLLVCGAAYGWIAVVR